MQKSQLLDLWHLLTWPGEPQRCQLLHFYPSDRPWPSEHQLKPLKWDQKKKSSFIKYVHTHIELFPRLGKKPCTYDNPLKCQISHKILRSPPCSPPSCSSSHPGSRFTCTPLAPAQRQQHNPGTALYLLSMPRVPVHTAPCIFLVSAMYYSCAPLFLYKLRKMEKD